MQRSSLLVGGKIECRTAHYSQNDLKKMTKGRNDAGMDALEKYQTTTLPKWIFFQKLFFKSSLPINCYCYIQFRPPTSSDDFCLLFCLILLLCGGHAPCLVGAGQIKLFLVQFKFNLI